MRLKASHLLGALALWCSPLHAQGARVSGIVYDSLAHAPLRGATVQLAPSDPASRFSGSAMSDSLGRYTIDSVPDGKYTLGFFHLILDSLAIAPPLREVLVTGRRNVQADIAIPSATRLRGAICRTPAAADTVGLVVGVIRDARDRAPVSGASVVGQWTEISLGAGKMNRRIPRLVATTGENGWFAICNVPRTGTMWLSAARGADSTAEIEVEIPDNGFVRRELYLGSGKATISGTVTTRPEGRAIPNARVGLAQGAQTRTNERGEFTLPNLPGGTRRLEVHAIGYYPEFPTVDVVDGATPVRVGMATMKSVLDTIRVTAAAVRREEEAFAERQRSGVGKYYTAETIARLNPVNTSDIFRQVPGMRKDLDTFSMRGVFQERCAPLVYIDGLLIGSGVTPTGEIPPAADVNDIDSWVQPDRIKAMEIYMPGTAPAEYTMAMQGCGVILIWTKRR